MSDKKYNLKRFMGNLGQDNRMSITKQYRIGLLSRFYIEEGIKGYEYALLFYDKDLRVIAIKFTNDKFEEGKTNILRHNHNKNNSGSLFVRSFFTQNNLNPDKLAGKYEWEKKKVEGIGLVYIIQLDKDE